MAVADWPLGLPRFLLVEGYQESIGEGRRFSKTDTGPGKVFRKTSAMADPLAGSMIMTEAQLQTFRAFHRDDLLKGSLPMNFPDPHDEEATLLVRFSFGATPAWTAYGLDWRVSLPLEVLP